MTRDEAIKLVNENPLIMSVLYDTNLLPEQCNEGSKYEGYMFSIIGHMLAAMGKDSPGAAGGRGK